MIINNETEANNMSKINLFLPKAQLHYRRLQVVWQLLQKVQNLNKYMFDTVGL